MILVSTSLLLFLIFLKVSLFAGFSVVLPSHEQLALELSKGTMHSWPADGQLPTIKLSVKYVILHKISIANWYLATNVSAISTTLGNLIFLISTGSKVDVEDFVFHHVLRYVDTFGITILICFPRLLCGFLLSQNPSILIEAASAGPTL